MVDDASCVPSAIDEARRLGRLPVGGYAASKQALRQATIEHVLATLDDDMNLLGGPS